MMKHYFGINSTTALTIGLNASFTIISAIQLYQTDLMRKQIKSLTSITGALLLKSNGGCNISTLCDSATIESRDVNTLMTMPKVYQDLCAYEYKQNNMVALANLIDNIMLCGIALVLGVECGAIYVQKYC